MHSPSLVHCNAPSHRHLPFPTRRSSDLSPTLGDHATQMPDAGLPVHHPLEIGDEPVTTRSRLNLPAGAHVPHGLGRVRSEEHTSELQSRRELVWRPLL